MPTNGTVVIDTTTTTGTTTISSVISGSTSLTINGTGTLSLKAANTFTGGIVLNAGTLSTPTQGSSLGAATATGGASSPAQLTFAGTSTLQIGNNNLLSTRPFAINSSVTATIDTGTNTGSGVQGVISGSGNLIKIGSGTLTLAGTNTYSGTTAVNAGALLVNGTGTVSVNNSGSILGGSGTITGATTVNSTTSRCRRVIPSPTARTRLTWSRPCLNRPPGWPARCCSRWRCGGGPAAQRRPNQGRDASPRQSLIWLG